MYDFLNSPESPDLYGRLCHAPWLATPGRTLKLANPLVISVVDDDEAVRDATAKLLRLHGFAAYAFASAEEFLASPRLADTACLITDINLPGMSGMELQRDLSGQGRRLPIIFITAFPRESSRVKALESEAVAFLTKPFNSQRLLDCVKTAVGI